MRELIQNRDLKTLFGGVAVAAAAGLMMGAAMHPDLDEGQMKAPQILLAGGGPRADVPASDAGVAAYRGRIPDHVIGTDALKPPEAVVLAYDDRAEVQMEEHAGDIMAYEAPPERPPARWMDEPREAPLYPSERGNTPYGADLPAPPEPPSGGDPVGDEAVLEG